MTVSDRHFGLSSDRVVTPDGVRAATVVIRGERIEAVVPRGAEPAGLAVEDLSGLVISPGVIDSHVHVNEPGRTDWEGFESATRAAAAGGVTTIVDMPLNSSPVTTTVAALDAKRQAAEGKCYVDVGFYGGLVPGNLAHIEPLIDAGVCGMKAFLCDSGLDEFPASSPDDVRAAAVILAQRQVPLVVHAEALIEWPRTALPTSCQSWIDSRPEAWEFEAIRWLRHLADNAHVHVVHLSSRSGVSLVKFAQDQQDRMTVETCPHYLFFGNEHFAAANTLLKCAPPLRGSEHRDALRRGLLAGVITTIGSDHSPCPPELKCIETSDWRRAWGGISSLQLTLPVVWTVFSKVAEFSQVAAWTAANPAELVGLSSRKGRLTAGWDADLCAWDPDEKWTVRGADLHHRHKLTPYEGEQLRGRVKRTYVRGQLAFDGDGFPAGPMGQLLRRNN
jgi:allantoinase